MMPPVFAANWKMNLGPQEARAYLQKFTAMKPRDARGHLALASAYFASDNASFINGAVLTVGGGWQGFFADYARWP